MFTICTFNAGSAHNVFPDEATLTGTIRAFTPEVMNEVVNKIKIIAENTAVALGCTAEIEIKGTDATMLPTINTEKEA